MQHLLHLLVLTFATSSAIYAKAALGPLQESMRIALSLSDNEIALLQGAALAVPMLFIGAPLGLLVDRWIRVRLVVMCALLLLVGSVITALAEGFNELFVGRAIVGLATFSMGPAIFSLIADLYDPAQRGRAYMVVLVAQFGAVSAMFSLGGAMVSTPSWGSNAWRFAILWLTGPLLAVVAVATLMLREPVRTGKSLLSPSLADSFIEFWLRRAVILPLLAGRILPTIALAALFVWSAPTFARALSLDSSHVGAIMAIAVPGGGICGTLLGGFLSDYCQRTGGPRRTITVAGSLVILSAPLGFFGLLPSTVLAGMSLAIAVATLTSVCVLGQSVSAIVIPNELRGLFSGVLSGIGAVISGAGAPLFVSALSGAMGGPAMIGSALGIACFISSILCAITYGSTRRNFPGRGS